MPRVTHTQHTPLGCDAGAEVLLVCSPLRPMERCLTSRDVVSGWLGILMSRVLRGMCCRTGMGLGVTEAESRNERRSNWDTCTGGRTGQETQASFGEQRGWRFVASRMLPGATRVEGWVMGGGSSL